MNNLTVKNKNEDVVEINEGDLLTVDNFDNLKAAAGNRIFTACFKKKDGSIRTLNGTFNMKGRLVGGKSTVDKSKYFILLDNHIAKKNTSDKGIRSVNKETILWVQINGVRWKKELSIAPYHAVMR